MKKNELIIIYILCYAIILLLLSACGRYDGNHLYDNHEFNTYLLNEQPALVPANVVVPWPYEVTQAQRNYFAHLTREDFIYDLNYLMAVLEENFEIFFGIMKRRLGVDLRANAESLRQVLANEDTELDPWIFASLMQAYICTPAHLIGHLRLFPPATYHRRLGMVRMEMQGVPHPNLTELSSPASVMFYGEQLPEEAEVSVDAPVANINWEIIEDGRIAYMIVRSMRFDANWVDDLLETYLFYGAITGFEHLVIDIRGNRGGHRNYFTQLVLDVFAKEPTYIYEFALHTTRGEYNKRLLEFYMQAGVIAEHWGGGIWHGSELMDKMIYLPEQYRKMFDITRDTSWEIGAIADDEWGYWLQSQLPARIFEGKIWLLIDGETHSAADVSARAAKQSGIATLVGEPSQGGHGAGLQVYVSLPNSGIVFMYDWGVGVDQYGRSFEEIPLSPHHYNFEGMDALETVLRLIADGLYY